MRAYLPMNRKAGKMPALLSQAGCLCYLQSRFMVPMHAKKRKGTLHERGSRRCDIGLAPWCICSADCQSAVSQDAILQDCPGRDAGTWRKPCRFAIGDTADSQSALRQTDTRCEAAANVDANKSAAASPRRRRFKLNASANFHWRFGRAG